MPFQKCSGTTSIKNEERGSVLVEFALTSIIYVIFILGIFDFGRAFLRVHQLTQIAREGARIASITHGLNSANGQTRIKDKLNEILRVIGLDPAKMTISIQPVDLPESADGVPDVVDVTVTQNFGTGLGVSFFPGLAAVNLSAKISMPVFTT